MTNRPDKSEKSMQTFREKEYEILKYNWDKINKRMDERIEQLKQIYEYHWYEASLQDPLYKDLCRILTELKIWKRRLYDPDI